MSAEVERHSLFNQAATIKPADPPSKERLIEAERELLKQYPRSRLPQVVRLIAEGDWEAVDRMVDDVLDTLKSDASSGYPLMRLQSTKGPLIKKERTLLRTAVVSRLKIYASGRVPSDPLELYLLGLVDPDAIFVKKEPHTSKKIRLGTERLIASVSTVDECIARLLFSAQNKAEIAMWETTPSKPGIGFDDSGIEKISRSIKQVYDAGGELASSDVSAWDFNMKAWMFESDVRRRTLLIKGASTDEIDMFYRLASIHHHAMTHSLFVLSDGSVYAQIGGGWMKSGSYVTSSTNSWGRCLLSVLCGSRADRVMAMGDDCIEESVSSEREYAALGYTLKMFQPSPDGHCLEFCCHVFGKDGVEDVERLNMEKSMFGLLHKKCTVEDQMQFRFEFRHHPQMERALDAMSRAGWVPANDAKKYTSGDCGEENAFASPPTSSS